MLIQKTLSLSEADIKMVGESGHFSGYASKWNGVDSYGDTILKGAFSQTLAKNGTPKMFFNHNWDMPVGKWLVAKEDDIGLFVEGELTPNLGISNDVHAAMKHGTLDGLSIGGFLKKGDYEEKDDGRIIRNWSSLMEVSAVVFPADGKARIESVKSDEYMEAINEIESIREFERFLRDASGLSKSASVALIARAKKIFGAEGEPSIEEIKAKRLQERIERLLENSKR